MALYKIQDGYFQQLLLDTEFEQDSQRLYYIVRQLDYKNEKVSIAVPLRSNINQNFQKTPNEYIATPPSYKTQTYRGNIAGWHFTKMVPIAFSETIVAKKLNPGLQIAMDMAKKYNNDEFLCKAKLMLKRIESRETIFGAIRFDEALEKLKKRQLKHTSLMPAKTATVMPVQSEDAQIEQILKTCAQKILEEKTQEKIKAEVAADSLVNVQQARLVEQVGQVQQVEQVSKSKAPQKVR